MDENKSLELIRRQALEARDDTYYDKLYALKLFIAGDMLSVREMLRGTANSYATDRDLGDYPDVDPPLGEQGVQNHSLVSSRINVQATVYGDPEFHFVVDDPLANEVNQHYLRHLWEMQDWGSVFLEIGMDVEAVGIGFAEIGASDGTVVMQRRDPMDMLWDPYNRSPGQWEWFFSRQRLSISEAMEKYGLTKEDAENIAK